MFSGSDGGFASKVKQAARVRGSGVVLVGALALLLLGNNALAQQSSLLNPNQDSMRIAIRNSDLPGPEDPALCPSLIRKSAENDGLPEIEQQLLDRCGRVVRATSALEQANALQEITAEELNAPKTNGRDFNRTMFSNIAARLTNLRGGRGVASVAYNGPDDSIPLLHTGGAAGDSDGRMGVFLNGSFGSGDKSRTDYEAAYDFDLFALTGGVDYRFTDNLIGGFALAYTDAESKYKDGSKLQSDGLAGSLFGSWYGANYYFDGILSYGALNHDSLRRVRYAITETNIPGEQDFIDHRASGDTDSSAFGAGLSFGFNFGSGGWRHGPLAAISYLKIDVDGFKEKGGNNPELNLDYGDSDAKSLQLQLGYDVSYAASLSWGVLSPYGRVVYISEQENDRSSFLIQYVNDPFQTVDTTATVTSDRPDSSFWRWGIGVSAVFANNLAGFVDYEAVEDLDTISYGELTVGLRYQF